MREKGGALTVYSNVYAPICFKQDSETIRWWRPPEFVRLMRGENLSLGFFTPKRPREEILSGLLLHRETLKLGL